MSNTSKSRPISLSIIIPVYNSADWIEETLLRIFESVERSGFEAEVIVIDDGSSDGSGDKVRALAVPDTLKLRVIDQENQGRYLARKAGIDRALNEGILFIDSRVYVDAGSLPFLYAQLKDDPDQIWNGHVRIDKQGNVFARFWDAITSIVWRKYFSNPRQVQYGIEEYDYYPKGTGFFYVPKQRLVPAIEHFERATNDLRHSSDDTLLIRFLNERQNIHLSPEFSCLYHGRSNAKDFLHHAYYRGQFFIDGFMRPGTRFFYPLVLILIVSIIAPVSLVFFFGIVALPLVCLLFLMTTGLLAVALFVGVQMKDALSLALLSIPFGFIYLCGLWRGVFRKYLKR